MKVDKSNEDCVMPDYKVLYEESAKQVEYWKQEHKNLLLEIEYLRGVKNTAEAFLGRKIGGENGKS